MPSLPRRMGSVAKSFAFMFIPAASADIKGLEVAEEDPEVEGSAPPAVIVVLVQKGVWIAGCLLSASALHVLSPVFFSWLVFEETKSPG